MKAPDALDLREHFVYRIFDEAGALLYIGCARDVDSRVEMHRSTTQTYGWTRLRFHYGHHTSEPYPTKAAARVAERAAIAAEAPLLNRQHNPKRWRRVAGQYEPVST
jgi:predicted GIY-YIG superfamily endonuclease